MDDKQEAVIVKGQPSTLHWDKQAPREDPSSKAATREYTNSCLKRDKLRVWEGFPTPGKQLSRKVPPHCPRESTHRVPQPVPRGPGSITRWQQNLATLSPCYSRSRPPSMRDSRVRRSQVLLLQRPGNAPQSCNPCKEAKRGHSVKMVKPK